MGASRVSDIVLPVEVVSLGFLHNRDGSPVRVRCEGVSQLVLAEVCQTLPGGHPREVEETGDALQDTIERMRAMNEWAPALIEAGTTLEDDDGNEVRPAFYFESWNGKPRPRHKLSLAGRLLREEDKALLVNTIMRLGGYGGAAAAEVFPAERVGAGDGVGAVEAVEGASGATAPADGSGAVAAGGRGVRPDRASRAR